MKVAPACGIDRSTQTWLRTSVESERNSAAESKSNGADNAW